MAKIRADLVGVVYPVTADGIPMGVVLAAGDTVPKGAVVGPHLLSTAATTEPTAPPAEPPAASTGVAGADDSPVEPPRAGKGATKAAWAAYAATLGIESAPDATREDFIAAVDEALGR